MRIAVCHPRTPFARGDAETHAEQLVRALQQAGHEADVVLVAGQWYPGSELLYQMGVWRSLDLSESDGLPIDAVIPLTFPAYLVPHERKIVWLIHEQRTAYELWDHSEYWDQAGLPDLVRREEAVMVRDTIRTAGRIALGEAERVFVNSTRTQRRLWDSLRIASEPLRHRSSLTESLLEAEPGPYGDVIVYPSRFAGVNRQTLAIDAMRYVRSDVRLLLAGRGPCESRLRSQIEVHGLREQVRIEVDPSPERLQHLFLNALGVYYGPYEEDFGYVPNEGFAARRPVVTLTDSGGPLESVLDGRTGFVAEPEPRAIAEAFDHLFEDRALAVRLGVTGRALLEEVPPWQEVVARLLS